MWFITKKHKFIKKIEEFNSRTLILLTKAHALHGTPTLKHIQRNFRKMPVQKLNFITVLTTSYDISHAWNDQNLTHSYNTEEKKQTLHCFYRLYDLSNQSSIGYPTIAWEKEKNERARLYYITASARTVNTNTGYCCWNIHWPVHL